jgi:hypothetical protein
MCVRALRITVLKSAGNFTRDEGHDLNAEKIQRVKCFMHEVRNLLRASNFRTPARPAGFENFRLWSIGESAVYFAMSGLPPEADTNRKGRHVRWVPKSEVFNGLGRVPLAQWMSAVRSRHRLPPPGRVMCAYQTSGHLPVAVAQAFVLTRPTRGVDTSAQAIGGLILTSRGCHCFRR